MNPESNEAAYVGLVAVVWDSLERIGERFECSRERDSSWRINDVRVELVRWKEASRHFARRTELSDRHRVRLQWLLTRTEEILDAGLHESAEQVGACIGQAQNFLFDEADRLRGCVGAARIGDTLSVTLHGSAPRIHGPS